MAGFATEAALKTALDAQNIFRESWHKNASGGITSSQLVGWFKHGPRPSAGADPATTPGTAYSNTAGGIVFPDTSPLRKYIVGFGAIQNSNQNNPGVVYLWDRLVGVSGIAMSSTGDKTINSTALTRYTDGVGIEVYLEITAAGNTTAPIVSMSSYTNQAGTSGRSGATITFPSATTSISHLIGPMPLASGDTGVRSIETINVATAGGGSGVVNVILVRPLLMLPATLHLPFERISPRPFHGPIRIFDGATLMMGSRYQSTSDDETQGYISVVYG